MFPRWLPLARHFFFRKGTVAVLLVGVLAGVTVGGGVGVIAASSSKSVTVCVDKKDNHMNYSTNGKCKSHQIKILLNQTGTTGATGIKGETGAVGVKGDPGVAGAKGDSGVAGTNGTNGAAGASSPTGFTARSVCGSDGKTLCEVGVQGPGGGIIVYVDSTNEMPGYDYLEVAPTEASTGVAWSTTTAKCGPTALASCRTSFILDAGSALKYLALGTGRSATAEIVARHSAGNVLKADYAAGVADAYTTATASDWWLPSRDELNEVCKYARATGQAAGALVVCSGGSSAIARGFAGIQYSSSSEYGTSTFEATTAWLVDFEDGDQYNDYRSIALYVRPVRGF